MQAIALLSLLASAAFAIDPKGVNATDGFDAVRQPEEDAVINAGSTFTIKWDTPSKYDGDKITINLIGGASAGLQSKIGEVASGLDNSDGSYEWHVKSSLGKEKVYGLQLINERDNSIWQYSYHFVIKSSGGSGGDDDSKSTSTGEGSATETETGSKSTSTATETGDDNETSTETSAPKSTETKTTSSSETSTSAAQTTLTPSKSTDASSTGTETASSTSSVTPTNAAVTLGASNMLALGGVAAAFFAL